MIYQALTLYFYQQKQSIKIFLDIFIEWIYCLMKIMMIYLETWKNDSYMSWSDQDHVKNE